MTRFIYASTSSVYGLSDGPEVTDIGTWALGIGITIVVISSVIFMTVYLGLVRQAPLRASAVISVDKPMRLHEDVQCLNMRRAVFLDRDGVINRVVVRTGRPFPPASVRDVEFLPGAAEAIEALRRADFRIIVVTNQPDVATGLQRRETVEAIHARLRASFPIDDIKVCYHADQDGCPCRKPKPGLLFEAAAQWSLDLSQSVIVGDRWRDIEAGKAAGCKTILVRGGYAERQAERPDAVVASLLEASRVILSNGFTGVEVVT